MMIPFIIGAFFSILLGVGGIVSYYIANEQAEEIFFFSDDEKTLTIEKIDDENPDVLLYGSPKPVAPPTEPSTAAPADKPKDVAVEEAGDGTGISVAHMPIIESKPADETAPSTPMAAPTSTDDPTVIAPLTARSPLKVLTAVHDGRPPALSDSFLAEELFDLDRSTAASLSTRADDETPDTLIAPSPAQLGGRESVFTAVTASPAGDDDNEGDDSCAAPFATSASVRRVLFDCTDDVANKKLNEKNEELFKCLTDERYRRDASWLTRYLDVPRNKMNINISDIIEALESLPAANARIASIIEVLKSVLVLDETRETRIKLFLDTLATTRGICGALKEADSAVSDAFTVTRDMDFLSLLLERFVNRKRYNISTRDDRPGFIVWYCETNPDGSRFLFRFRVDAGPKRGTGTRQINLEKYRIAPRVCDETLASIDQCDLATHTGLIARGLFELITNVHINLTGFRAEDIDALKRKIPAPAIAPSRAFVSASTAINSNGRAGGGGRGKALRHSPASSSPTGGRVTPGRF